jgi:hypothetical protein
MANDDNNNDTLSMLKTGVWEKNIETLILNHRQISKLDLALEAFVNLRKL